MSVKGGGPGLVCPHGCHHRPTPRTGKAVDVASPRADIGSRRAVCPSCVRHRGTVHGCVGWRMHGRWCEEGHAQCLCAWPSWCLSVEGWGAGLVRLHVYHCRSAPRTGKAVDVASPRADTGSRRAVCPSCVVTGAPCTGAWVGECTEGGARRAMHGVCVHVVAEGGWVVVFECGGWGARARVPTCISPQVGPSDR